MGSLFVDTGPNSQLNSGSTDSNTADLSGTAVYVSGTNSVVLDALTDLTAVDATPGSATQSTINIIGATNQVSWVTGKSGSGGATPTLTLAANITGAGTGAYKIGGRFTYLGSNSTNVVNAAMRQLDLMVYNNSPVSRTASFIIPVTAGTDTTGRPIWMGKTGTYATFTVSNNSKVVDCNSINLQYFANLILTQTGGTNAALATLSLGSVFTNCKCVSAAGNGITGAAGSFTFACESTQSGGDGYGGGTHQSIIGCNVHDNVGNGFVMTGAIGNQNIHWCVVDTNGIRGISQTSTVGSPQTDQCTFMNNTVYGNVGDGLSVLDKDTPVTLVNNIFMNNGNNSVYNIQWLDGSIEFTGAHYFNCFYQTFGPNTLNFYQGPPVSLIVNATEITSDPLLADVSNGNFYPTPPSPCRATGYPGQFIGTSGGGYAPSLGYACMGAVQAIPLGNQGFYFNPGLT